MFPIVSLDRDNFLAIIMITVYQKYRATHE